MILESDNYFESNQVQVTRMQMLQALEKCGARNESSNIDAAFYICQSISFSNFTKIHASTKLIDNSRQTTQNFIDFLQSPATYTN
jgi:hypothetical protein